MVIEALSQAIDVRHRAGATWEPGRWIHHWEAGAQDVSLALSAELGEAGIAGSIGAVGDALDNALCESTIGLFKTEAIDDGGPSWKNHREVEWQVAGWVHWYNTGRLHSSIGDVPPLEFEQAHQQASLTTSIPLVASPTSPPTAQGGSPQATTDPHTTLVTRPRICRSGP